MAVISFRLRLGYYFGLNKEHMDCQVFQKVKILAKMTRDDPNRVRHLVTSKRLNVPQCAKEFATDLLELDVITLGAIMDLYENKYKSIDVTGDYKIVREVYTWYFK